MSIRAIILTKSAMRKNGKKGACTTAFDIDSHRIVRFVSDMNGSPLPYSVTDPFEPLDVVEVETISACPKGPQTENIYVDIDSFSVCGHYDGQEEKLFSEISGLYTGQFCFMQDTDYKTDSVSEYSHSLEIIKVTDFIISQTSGYKHSGKASFVYKGKRYDRYSITDNDYDIRGKNISEWDIGDAYLAVSIPNQPFEKDGYFYKFIAAVFPVKKEIKVKGRPVIYDVDEENNLFFSASYSGFAPNFTINGTPQKAAQVPSLQHSFVCVLKNILSRAQVMQPSQYIREQMTMHSKLFKDELSALETIVRYQFTILALAEKGIILFSDDAWYFNTDSNELFRIAAEDTLLWIKNLYTLAGESFRAPCVEFSFSPNAIRITNRFTIYGDPQADGIEIFNAPGDDYYHVSSGRSIDYNIEQNPANEKREAMRFLLFNIFGYDDFNQGQTQIITNILNRKRTIGILPTGGGKSLCYQFAAILQPGVSFSVCPLSSLSQDQKDNLDEFGFTRTNFIISDQTREEKIEILDNFAMGKYQLIWISPERFQSEEFRNRLSSLHNVSYAIIDEVHCLSEWGHDFRTSYLTLIPTIETICPNATLVGLTATASQAVLKDLKIEFNINNMGVRALPSLQRENLTMHVIETTDKLSEVERLLNNEDIANESSVGIIFTVFKDKSGDKDKKAHNFALLDEIRQIRPDLNSEKYHADIKNKRDIQGRFKDGGINILSSTKAFGMGINKDDIRYTIHYNLPWSVESFYQEAGRAGRGPKKNPADCYILYTPENPKIHQEVLRLFERNTTPEEIADIQKRYQNYLFDIGSIFFLWGLNNQGIDKDIDDISIAMEKFRVAIKFVDEDGRLFKTVETDRNIQKDKLELAIYRLKLLGYVTDWTIEWGYKTVFKCYLADEYTAGKAQDSMFRYIRRYDPSFGKPWTKETEKYKAIIEDNSMTELRRYMRALLSWSYDHIIYSRRRMIYNIKDFCENYTDPVSFRKRIDDFLRISDSNVVLEGVVESPELWEAWFDIFYNSEVIEGEHSRIFLSVDECSALRDTTARYLESYKNVTGLNLIYCLSGAISGRYNPEIDHEIMASVISDIQEKYAADSSAVLTAIESFISEHAEEMNNDALVDIADCIIEEHQEKALEYYKKYHNNYAIQVLISDITERINKAVGRIYK